jgi:SAM-dependent methyltransferase
MRMNPEFDAYSRNYNAGMDDPVKAAFGKSAEIFLLAKIELLFRYLRTLPRFVPDNPDIHAIDFGCGAGDFLALLAEQGCRWQTEGCDISEGMLAEARLRHPTLRSRGTLWCCDPNRFPQSYYDIVTAVCVFHHIPPRDWSAWFSRLRTALRPGGLFVLFEHNPWNPVTRWIVSRAAIDRNAVLLSPPTACGAIEASGFQIDTVRYFLFLPPRYRAFRRVERLIAGLPFGGQYWVTARK